MEINVFNYERFPLLGGKAQMFSRVSMSKLVLIVTEVLKLVYNQGEGTQPPSLLSPPGAGSVRLCNAMEAESCTQYTLHCTNI